MDVELDKERSEFITQKLAPLARLVPESNMVSFDVVVRKVKRNWRGEQYCVSVRMSTQDKKYYAIANETYLEKAFSKVRNELRKAISKSYKSKEYSLPSMQRFIKERQYLELFA